ncbi:MAG: DUF2877 domain-containing protein [Thermoanaerobaculia bacterium]|nr:DUF2877 domain-containing protein [Thermoanaerobaculia bacterium]
MRVLELPRLAAVPPEASPARPPLPCRELDPLPGPVSRATLVLDLACIPLPARTRSLLSGREGAPDSVEDRVFRWAHARLRALVTTLLAGDVRVAAYRPDAAALTGLGPGLTPTGDDLLVGLAAMARRLAGGGLVEIRAAVAYSTALAGLPSEETTPAAHLLLQNAAKGLFPSVLASAVEMIGNPHADAEALRTLTERLAATGAHSGADLLAGAVALAQAATDPEEAP